jgi:predicted nucleic-acid-binding protein
LIWAPTGEIFLVTGPPVLFEVAWTLKSFYKMRRERIYECLTAILGISGLEVSDIGVLEEALELYKRTSADLSDAYVAVLSKKVEAEAVATFNENHFKDLDVKIYALEWRTAQFPAFAVKSCFPLTFQLNLVSSKDTRSFSGRTTGSGPINEVQSSSPLSPKDFNHLATELTKT